MSTQNISPVIGNEEAADFLGSASKSSELLTIQQVRSLGLWDFSGFRYFALQSGGL